MRTLTIAEKSLLIGLDMNCKKHMDRSHIVEGLKKALSILDEVIATIRASKDKRDAKDNLIC